MDVDFFAHTIYLCSLMAGLLALSPLFLGVLLLFSASAVGLLFANSSHWFFYSLVLIFLGGMMVLILYVSAMSENEKHLMGFLNKGWKGVAIGGVAFSAAPLIFTVNSQESVGAIFQSCATVGFLMSYLLIGLFMAVKNAQGHKGALAKFS